MTFTEVKERVENGEVAIVGNINNISPTTFIEKNKHHFSNWTIQDDTDKAGCLWIFDSAIRAQREYNPSKGDSR